MANVILALAFIASIIFAFSDVSAMAGDNAKRLDHIEKVEIPRIKQALAKSRMTERNIDEIKLNLKTFMTRMGVQYEFLDGE